MKSKLQQYVKTFESFSMTSREEEQIDGRNSKILTDKARPIEMSDFGKKFDSVPTIRVSQKYFRVDYAEGDKLALVIELTVSSSRNQAPRTVLNAYKKGGYTYDIQAAYTILDAVSSAKDFCSLITDKSLMGVEKYLKAHVDDDDHYNYNLIAV